VAVQAETLADQLVVDIWVQMLTTVRSLFQMMSELCCYMPDRLLNWTEDRDFVCYSTYVQYALCFESIAVGGRHWRGRLRAMVRLLPEL
jgi:hypothetical protein